MQRIIAWLFNILFLVTPLILFPKTSEIFEFNKIIFVYGMTTIIVAVWLSRCIAVKKFIFRRTILDYPLIGYLVALLISTLTSIDLHTSIFGYYGRFNGGLLSVLCYSLLYWAYVSNMDRKSSLNTVHCSLFTGAVVAIIAALEHFGIFTTCKLMGFSLTESCWQQDVQHRVFSTLGQPNWLAGYLVALLPTSLHFAMTNNQLTNYKQYSIYNIQYTKILFIFLSTILFIALLFTKSRSGLLGFGVANFVFWVLTFWKFRFRYWKLCVICNLFFVILFSVFNPLFTDHRSPITSQETTLETGGTDSGAIRKLVWKGAVNIWQTYPLLGTGPETFAYAYYQFRPVEHNLVSEWDFVYNKAHNEFLNHLATTGSLGLLAYLNLIVFSIIHIFKNLNSNIKYQNSKQFQNLKLKNYDLFRASDFVLQISLFAGYVGLLVVNFFNFSVVVTQLQLFLFPALAVVSSTKYVESKKQKRLTPTQKIIILCILLSTYYILHTTYLYWLADYNYSKKTIDSTKKAIQIIPNEALYHIQLANLYADANKAKESEEAIKTSIELSPANVSLKRLAFTVYLKLSVSDKKYLLEGAKILQEAIAQSPTNPKFIYNLGLLYGRSGETQVAIDLMKKAIEIKANYKDARLAYALLLVNTGETQKAKLELEYILNNIDPTDPLARQTLEEIK